MIILDSNVLSAAMGEATSRPVMEWLAAQSVHNLYLTAIGVYEIEYGLASAPDGRKLQQLRDDYRRLRARGCNPRVLELDANAGRIAAQIASGRKERGIVVGLADTLLAGIVVAHGATLATRNVKHFADLPIEVVDPWGEDDPGG